MPAKIYRITHIPKPEWTRIKRPEYMSRRDLKKAMADTRTAYPGVDIRLLDKSPYGDTSRWVSISRRMEKRRAAHIDICVDNVWRSAFCVTKRGRRIDLKSTSIFDESGLHPGHMDPSLIPYRHAFTPEYRALVSRFPEETGAAYLLCGIIDPKALAQWDTDYREMAEWYREKGEYMGEEEMSGELKKILDAMELTRGPALRAMLEAQAKEREARKAAEKEKMPVFIETDGTEKQA